MADLGKAYVQIIPTAKGISGKIGQMMQPGAAKAGESSGSSIAGGIKKAIAGAAIGAAVVGTIKAAIDEGGKLQQSYGGLETIYGDAAGAAKQYAAEAAKAGISANSYAEQAVSFGASLKQAFAGDTTKAVEAANTAIMDMTDNAAKMGTPIESIQNAYQGFAKQNYTMLDNLKLGYGGTKTEMERLLADAQKISGVEYNIDNLGDVYDAIHVIQGELGLTGVAAEEASSTLSGSFGAMKASWENLLGAMALGEDLQGPIKEMASNAATFLFDNLLPMVGNVVKALPGAIVTFIQTGGPQLLQAGSDLIQSIKNGITTYAPQIVEALPGVLQWIGTAIQTYAPQLLQKGGELLTQLAAGIVQYAPQVWTAVQGAITTAVQYIQQKAPEWAAKGGELLGKLAQGLVENSPKIFETIGRIGVWILEQLGRLGASLFIAGFGLLGKIVEGIGNGIATLLGPVIESIGSAIETGINGIKNWITGAWNSIKSVTSSVWNGIKSVVSSVASGIRSAVSAPINAVKNVLTSAWNSIKSVTSSVWNGIKNAITTPINTAKTLVTNAINGIKNLFSGLKLQLPKFKLPHFNIDGGKFPFGLGGEGRKPNISVSWYAKGGVFDAPSVIGVGEAGAEAVVPLSGDRMRPFAEAIAEEMGGRSGMENTFYITVDGAENPEDFADRLVRRLQLRARMSNA